ncbi:hypothetical protein [Flagellimonas allohymeniacidonis]|uniref:Uncharacterized protein n=1 Tax=Flagellimonas allohymeniacidonis TaxID=2517819 RepID=A0A4Q8QFS6_9FLAO|nr:hypothetical protein [Allomuricauda hymeniacidonis]TAI46956.1 hypothetical protein EW142_09660 [Allomuricauda hymeniacidonis]
MDENEESQKPKHLFNMIKEGYGSPSKLAEVLDQGVEMLFYVEEGAFARAEIQNVAAALRSICGVLRG